MASFFGLNTPDLLNGGAENDLIRGKNGNDTLNGNDGKDSIYGDADNDLIHGNAGNDVIYGGQGNDTAYGDGGNDKINGDAGDDVIYGDDANGGGGTQIIPGKPAQQANNITATAFSATGAAVPLVFHPWTNNIILEQNVTGGRLNNEIDYQAGVGAERVEINFGINSVDAAKVDIQLLFNNLTQDTRLETLKWEAYDANNVKVAEGTANGTVDGKQTLVINPDAPFQKLVFMPQDNGLPAGDYSNSDFRIHHVEAVIAGTPDQTIDGGNGGDDTLNGGTGNDSIHGGGGNDVIYGGDDHDKIWGDDGNDKLSGDKSCDVIDGGKGNDTIIGGADCGEVITTKGGAGGSFVNVKFLTDNGSGFANTFGYYLKDANGNPTEGKILWSSVKGVAPGTEQIFNTADASKVGFFLIPNGGFRNAGINAGDNVTFTKVGSDWVVQKNGVSLLGDDTFNNAGNGQHPTAYFSDSALNSDGIAHAKDSADAGNSNWEDLKGGGDKDYNDANFQIDIHANNNKDSYSFKGGDTLTGGEGNDTFIYNPGDGYDTITDFNATGNDVLVIKGITASHVDTFQQGTDTFVFIDDGNHGGILLTDTTVAEVQAHTTYA